MNINLSIYKVIFSKIASGCRRYLEAVQFSDELVTKLNAVESTCAVNFYTVVDTSRSPVHYTPCPLHWVRDSVGIKAVQLYCCIQCEQRPFDLNWNLPQGATQKAKVVAFDRSDHNFESYKPVVILMHKAPISAKYCILLKF